MAPTECRLLSRISRQDRDARRIRLAAAAARDAPRPALAAALAQIGTAFDEAASINALKMRVEQILQLGPRHAALRARYRACADRLHRRDLDAAVVLVERCWREERKAFQIASALGCATRLPIEILSELRLILRLMRRKRMQADFAAVVAAWGDEPPAMAAE